jgi:hypothetical protein
MTVLEFHMDFRNLADQARIVEKHAALILSSLVHHPFLSGEIATLVEESRRSGECLTFLQLVDFLTEDSVSMARQELYTSRMEPQDTV